MAEQHAGANMISADLIVTIPHYTIRHQPCAQYLSALPHCDPIDIAARGIIHPITLQQQALPIAQGYARFGQSVMQSIRPNINALNDMARKLRAGL